MRLISKITPYCQANRKVKLQTLYYKTLKCLMSIDVRLSISVVFTILRHSVPEEMLCFRMKKVSWILCLYQLDEVSELPKRIYLLCCSLDTSTARSRGLDLDVTSATSFRLTNVCNVWVGCACSSVDFAGSVDHLFLLTFLREEHKNWKWFSKHFMNAFSNMYNLKYTTYHISNRGPYSSRIFSDNLCSSPALTNLKGYTGFA